MTKRIKKNLDWLNALACCKSSEQKRLLSISSPEKINAVCDCIKNVLNGNVPVSAETKKKLSTKKKLLRELVDRSVKVPARRRKLIQLGGGFGLLSAVLLPTLIGLGKTIIGK